MKAKMMYLAERFAEPGSKRSLAVVLFALRGVAPEFTEAVIELAIVVLGMWSFAQPEAKPR